MSDNLFIPLHSSITWPRELSSCVLAVLGVEANKNDPVLAVRLKISRISSPLMISIVLVSVSYPSLDTTIL